MMNPAGLETAAWAVLSWLFTYAVHSTILLGLAFLVGSRFTADPAWKELLWKAALLGSLATASVQLAAGFTPLGGRWNLQAAAVEPAMPAALVGDEPQPSYPNAAAMDTASSEAREIPPAPAPPGVEGSGVKARPVFSGLRRGLFSTQAAHVNPEQRILNVNAAFNNTFVDELQFMANA